MTQRAYGRKKQVQVDQNDFMGFPDGSGYGPLENQIREQWQTTAAGFDYRLTPVWRSRSRGGRYIDHYALQLPYKAQARLALRPQDGFDRWALGAGISSELQTSDAQFDEAVFVDCDNEAMRTDLTLSSKKRTAALEVLAGGADSIEIDSAGVFVRLPVTFGTDGASAASRERLEALVAAAQSLTHGLEPSRTRADPGQSGFVAMRVLGLVAFLPWFGFALVDWELRRGYAMPYEIILISYWAALLPLSVLLLLGWLKFGPHRAAKHWHALRAAGVFLVVAGSAAPGFANLNRNLADDPGQPVVSRVIGREVQERSGTKPDLYYLNVRDALAPDRQFRIEVSRGEYRRARLATLCLAYQQKQGAFGFDFHEGFSVISARTDERCAAAAAN